MTTVLIAIAALLALAAVFGAALGFASEKFKVEGDPIVDQIDGLLPQTQCGQCGHPGCRPYAEAIAEGEEHNRCPPGGEATVEALADLLGREVLPWTTTAPKPPARTGWPGSARTSASAAPSASRPARWTPSSAPPSRCTP